MRRTKPGDWPWGGFNPLYGCLGCGVALVVLPFVLVKSLWDFVWGNDSLPMD